MLIGPAAVDGAFTPGELLKAALAGCAGMSADSVIARRLGDDFTATYWAHGTSDEAENRYKAIDEEIVIDGLDEMSIEDRARLISLIERSIEKSCTVARSVGERHRPVDDDQRHRGLSTTPTAARGVTERRCGRRGARPPR